MLIPESMSRVVIVGTKARMQDAIDALYAEQAIHVIDHTTGDDGMSIGAPCASTSKASERLLKVRAMEKELGIAKKAKTAQSSVEDLRTQIESGSVEGVEGEVLKAVDARNDLNQKITELNSKKRTLELLQRLPLTLDMYSGYHSLAVMVGTTTVDAGPALKDLAYAECFTDFSKKDRGIAAVFVQKEAKEQAAGALAECGFVEMSVPVTTEKVKPADALVKLNADIEECSEKMKAADLALGVLKAKYMSFLKGTDEELAIEIEKGSLPLRVAVSKYSYVIDAWVPTVKVDRIKADLETKLGNDVYVEFEETRTRKLAEENDEEPRFKNVPTKQHSGKITKEFEYATSLVSVPKYQEIDPTMLIMIFLPLFFGYMVGDCGYAIPFIILGAYGLKVTHNKDWRSIAVVLFFGGIWAFIFGFLFYGEALGMHFIGGEYVSGVWTWNKSHVAVGGTAVTWDWILGVRFPDWFAGLLPVVDEGAGIGKLEDVSFLLKLAVYIGIIHLLIGHFCGLINIKMQHGSKAAFMGKGGVIITFIAMVAFCWTLTEMMFHKVPMEGTLLTIMVISIVFLVIGVAINSKHEGMMAVMDLPGIIGNILSYTRLAAIAMSKAGMALAFNYIVFGMMMPTKVVDGITMFDPSSSVGMVIFAIIIFCFLHLVVWTLAILSGGLHALRLQYVELMTKFFEGNGIKFAPLRELRKKTFFSAKADNNVKEV